MAVCDTCNREYLDSYDECPFCIRRERRRREAQEYVKYVPTRAPKPVMVAIIGGAASVVGIVIYLLVQLALGGSALPGASAFAQRQACFLEQAYTERAAAVYTARTGLPVASVAVLVGPDLASAPKCPAGGRYTWDVATGHLVCSLHGWHGNERQAP